MNLLSNESSKKYKKMISHMNQVYFALITKSKEILEIGKGDGFVSTFLANYCNITTADLNQDLKPNIILDISKSDDFLQFKDNSFDLIIVCEVLEHVSYTKLETILKNLQRITKKYVLISVPNQKNVFYLNIIKKGFNHRLYQGFIILIKLVARIVNSIGTFLSNLHYKKIKSKRIFKFDGEHHWELGIQNYNEEEFIILLKKYFKIIMQGRLKENLYHHFFLLKK